MLLKHPDQYEDRELDEWVHHLVDEKVSEGPRLDYKATIDLKGDKAKLEAAKDISSFANEIGGTIIYGIPDDKQSDEVAIPREPYGMDPIPGLEEQLENIYVGSILPCLPEYRIRKVELTKYPGKVVYIVWTPESWLGPHMVSAYAEKRYYHRGLLRAVLMEEHEVRLRYERSQMLRSQVYRFANFQQELFANHYQRFIEPSQRPFLSNYILCPQFLDPERVQLSSPSMREWLAKNQYIEVGGSSRRWRPCAEGVETYESSDETTEDRIKFGEVIIFKEGGITRWGETKTERKNSMWLLNHGGESGTIWKFFEFGAKFFQAIAYYGPLLYRFSLYNPKWVKLCFLSDFYVSHENPPLRSRGQSPLNVELPISSAELFKDPKLLTKRIGDELWRFFGREESPQLRSKYWRDVFWV